MNFLVEIVLILLMVAIGVVAALGGVAVPSWQLFTVLSLVAVYGIINYAQGLWKGMKR